MVCCQRVFRLIGYALQETLHFILFISVFDVPTLLMLTSTADSLFQPTITPL